MQVYQLVGTFCFSAKILNKRARRVPFFFYHLLPHVWTDMPRLDLYGLWSLPDTSHSHTIHVVSDGEEKEEEEGGVKPPPLLPRRRDTPLSVG